MPTFHEMVPPIGAYYIRNNMVGAYFKIFIQLFFAQFFNSSKQNKTYFYQKSNQFCSTICFMHAQREYITNCIVFTCT